MCWVSLYILLSGLWWEGWSGLWNILGITLLLIYKVIFDKFCDLFINLLDFIKFIIFLMLLFKVIIVGRGALVRRSLCLFWREAQIKGLSSRSPTRPEVNKETKVPEKTQSQLTKEDRERQLTMVDRDGRTVGW